MTQFNFAKSAQSSVLKTLALGTAISFAAISPTIAQRGSSGRGDSGSSRSEGSRSESSRSDSSPRRDDSSSRRDYSPPSRSSDSSSRREYSPPSRTYDSPSRRDDSPRRDYTPSQRSSDTPVRRDDSPRRDYTPPSRRDDTPLRSDERPRRDSTPGARSDDTTIRRDTSPSRDDSSRPSRDRAVDPARHTDTEGSINRSRPTGAPNRGQDDRSVQERNRDAVTRGPLGRNPDLPAPYRGGPLGTNRSVDPSPHRNRASDIFTRSAEGRRYINGIVLRDAVHVSHPVLNRYFPSSYCHFGFYSPVFSFSTCYYSPFSFYYGLCPSYIYRSHCFYTPPPYIYIEVPVYVGSESRGYDSDRDDYYLSRGKYSFDETERETGLDRAADDIREAFRFGNIEPLVQLTDPNIKIAVFRKGHYEYSMTANDYLDLTRDAIKNTDTIRFDLYRVKKRAAGVYVVSGQHEYKGQDGQRRTVFVSFVLERVYSRWTLTQVGTAPDRIQD